MIADAVMFLEPKGIETQLLGIYGFLERFVKEIPAFDGDESEFHRSFPQSSFFDLSS
jgi:hypothetical protein